MNDNKKKKKNMWDWGAFALIWKLNGYFRDGELDLFQTACVASAGKQMSTIKYVFMRRIPT